jgi:hypothetical protein
VSVFPFNLQEAVMTKFWLFASKVCWGVAVTLLVGSVLAAPHQVARADEGGAPITCIFCTNNCPNQVMSSCSAGKSYCTGACESGCDCIPSGTINCNCSL